MGCGASVPAKSLVTHQQNGCQNRDVVCELCGVSFVAKDGDQHKRRYCPMRQVQCRLGCIEKFPAKNTEDHEHRACAMRLITCTKGCGETCAAKDQPSHERSCRGPVVPDLSLLRSSRPRSSLRIRPPPLSHMDHMHMDHMPIDNLGTDSMSPNSPILPEIESPGRRVKKHGHGHFPSIRGESPERMSKTKCNTCGHSERHCSGCFGPFCSRCLVRSGLPKNNPPLCAPCCRENSVRTRELMARGGPSPMRFGGGNPNNRSLH